MRARSRESVCTPQFGHWSWAELGAAILVASIDVNAASQGFEKRNAQVMESPVMASRSAGQVPQDNYDSEVGSLDYLTRTLDTKLEASSCIRYESSGNWP